MILIGGDPHKSSHTTVAVDAAGHQVVKRWFVVNAGTFRRPMRRCEQWPDRRSAIECTGGLGPLARPATGGRGRESGRRALHPFGPGPLRATGGDRKTDAKDALPRRPGRPLPP